MQPSGSDPDEAGPNYYFRLVDYAYGDSGEIVIAGQKESKTSAPVLESLGGLALGGAGLLAWRQRRQTLVHQADLANKPRRERTIPAIVRFGLRLPAQFSRFVE